MLTCRELTELVNDYVEGRLSLSDRLRFQMHMGMCDSCRDYVQQLKITKASVSKLPEVPLPPEVRDEMLERFRAWKRGEDVSPPALPDAKVDKP